MTTDEVFVPSLERRVLKNNGENNMCVGLLCELWQGAGVSISMHSILHTYNEETGEESRSNSGLRDSRVSQSVSQSVIVIVMIENK